jgi:signal transduction histidine kinase
LQNNLELVRDFPLEPDERDECLLTCTREVEQLLTITQRMLSFARTERHTVRPVTIQAIWQQAYGLLGKSLENASVQISVDFPDTLPPVLAVADQIGQVLLNLVLNALEVMPKGGRLQLAARQQGEMLVLTVVNDGPSIPKEYLDHIFDPFFTTKPDGTGLGLFISHNIVQQHGGTLSVENTKDGQGVRFSMTLPVLSGRGVNGLPPEKETGV